MQVVSSPSPARRRILLVLATLALVGVGVASVQAFDIGTSSPLKSKNADGEKPCDERCEAEKAKWFACVEEHGEAYCKAQWMAAKAKKQ